MTLRNAYLYAGLLAIVVLAGVLALPSCKIKVTVSEGGAVHSESGSFACQSGATCILDVTDTSFDETFIATPDEGYHFAGWEHGEGYLCGGSVGDCRLATGGLEGLEWVLGEDIVFPLTPRFVRDRVFEFTPVDTLLQYLLANGILDGFSLLILHRDFGTVFQKAYGDFEIERVVQLRSASKLASATLLMALEHDPRTDFQVSAPIETYLPFEGVYGDRTTEQLLSQTSGIPGNAFWIYYEPHLCQYQADADFHECGRQIYQTELIGTRAAGAYYSYGGSQWQLAGLVASHASGKTWGDLFEKLIATPCDMPTFHYGNIQPHSQAITMDGNPNIEGGAISNLHDFGRLIALHLEDGWCGNRRILAPGAVPFMREDRAKPAIPPEEELAGGYAMGAFVEYLAGPESAPIHMTPGALGTVAWIDSGLDYGAVFLAEASSVDDYPAIRSFVRQSLIPAVREAMTPR